MNYNWELVKVFIYLALIIGIIILVAKFIKKGYSYQNNGKYLKLIEQLYLGQKKYLSLVKVKNKIFLLSVGEDKIEKIEDWSEAEFGNLDLKSNSEFQGKLKQLLKGNWRDRND